MNILQITSDYVPNPLWGMGWHVQQVVQGLRGVKSNNVYVATAFKSKDIHECILTTEKEIDNQLLSSGKYEIFNDFNNFQLWQKELAKVIVNSSIDFDVIHCHNWMSWITAREVKKHHASVKIFITFHFLQKQYELMKDNPIPSFHNEIINIEQEAISNADGVIVLSDSQENLIRTNYLIPSVDNIHLIPHSVNFDIESYDELIQYRNREVNTNILFVGRIEEDKGVRELIEGYMKVHASYPLTQLDIVGDGPLLKILNEKNNHKDIKFHGYLDRDSIKFLLMKSHIFCMPSSSENLPLTVLEAMFFGVVPVFTQGITVPNIYDNGVEGILIPLKLENNRYVPSSKDIEDSLVYLVKEPEQRNQMSFKAYSTSVKKYSKEAMINNLMNLYLGL